MCFYFFFWGKIVSPVFKSCFATCFVTFEDVLRVLVKSSDVGFEIGILGKRFVALVALCFLICAAEVLILSQSSASEMPAHCWQHRNRQVQGWSTSVCASTSRVTSSRWVWARRRVGSWQVSFSAHPTSPWSIFFLVDVHALVFFTDHFEKLLFPLVDSLKHCSSMMTRKLEFDRRGLFSAAGRDQLPATPAPAIELTAS